MRVIIAISALGLALKLISGKGMLWFRVGYVLKVRPGMKFQCRKSFAIKITRAPLRQTVHGLLEFWLDFISLNSCTGKENIFWQTKYLALSEAEVFPIGTDVLTQSKTNFYVQILEL